MYDPVWTALHERGAIVFIHGTQTPSLTPVPHPTLGLPVTEVNTRQPEAPDSYSPDATSNADRFPTRRSKLQRSSS